MLELFPNAKFIFMVRDGRATVHSIISRKVMEYLGIRFFKMASQRSLFLGHHYGLRSDVLSSIIDQMESRYFRDVRAMSGGRTRKMFNGTVRTAGTASETMDEEDIKLFGRALERIGDAPRGIY